MKRNVVMMIMPTGRRVSSFVNDHLQSKPLAKKEKKISHPREMATEAIDKSILEHIALKERY